MPVLGRGDASERLVLIFLDTIALLLRGNTPVLCELTGPRRANGAIEGAVPGLYADQVIGAIGRFILQTAKELPVVGSGAGGQQFFRLQQAPYGAGNLLRVEKGRKREMRKVLSIVTGSIILTTVEVKGVCQSPIRSL
jgi:hypothetical protein